MANSLAIATDAAHMLTDFAGFMISIFSIYVASRPPTSRMSFGWHRAGTDASFIWQKAPLEHVLHIIIRCKIVREDHCLDTDHVRPTNKLLY